MTTENVVLPVVFNFSIAVSDLRLLFCYLLVTSLFIRLFHSILLVTISFMRLFHFIFSGCDKVWWAEPPTSICLVSFWFVLIYNYRVQMLHTITTFIVALTHQHITDGTITKQLYMVQKVNRWTITILFSDFMFQFRNSLFCTW